jgi:cytochrome c oxidase subunit IV
MTYKAYWGTWFALLLVTVAMIAAGNGTLAGRALLALLLVAMLIKIGLICGNFMHLRRETRSLILIVALGLLAVGLVLFAGILPDAMRVQRLSILP